MQESYNNKASTTNTGNVANMIKEFIKIMHGNGVPAKDISYKLQKRYNRKGNVNKIIKQIEKEAKAEEEKQQVQGEDKAMGGYETK